MQQSYLIYLYIQDTVPAIENETLTYHYCAGPSCSIRLLFFFALESCIYVLGGCSKKIKLIGPEITNFMNNKRSVMRGLLSEICFAPLLPCLPCLL